MYKPNKCDEEVRLADVTFHDLLDAVGLRRVKRGKAM